VIARGVCLYMNGSEVSTQLAEIDPYTK